MSLPPKHRADPAQAQRFLAENPDIAFVEVIFTGLNGVSRGKRLRAHELQAVYEQGRFLPNSTLVADITGKDVDETGLVFGNGDADVVGWPIDGTLVRAPWLGSDTAQVAVSLHELDGAPCDLDPRNVLARVVDRFAADGLTPVVACELEFYLVDIARSRTGLARLARNATTRERPWGHNTYGLRELEDVGPFLRELWAGADVQGLPLEGAISEYAPGQLEIGLRHRPDALRAADDAVFYKRLAKGVALRHGAEATFMAKPFAEIAGSGFHIHVSVADSSGANIMAGAMSPAPAPLRYAIGGMRHLLAPSMAVLAPNANSFRRFKANSYAPVNLAWGVNNRTVPFRVPAGSDGGRHIEHRVAGADANPYLALAVILAAVHHGLSHRIDPGPPVEGNGYEAKAEFDIPNDWLRAIELFEADAVMADYLGARFVKMFSTVKRVERERFNETVTALDYDWYLRTA